MGIPFTEMLVTSHRPISINIGEHAVEGQDGHVTGLASMQCHHPGPSRLRPCQAPGLRARSDACNAVSLASSFQRPTWALFRLALPCLPPAWTCHTAEIIQ